METISQITFQKGLESSTDFCGLSTIQSRLSED